jgi:hypothetical protein
MSSTRYCWINNLKTGKFLANSRENVRIMGTLIDTRDIPEEDHSLVPKLTIDNNGEEESSNSMTMKLITIEDGTDSISFWTPKQMVDSLVAGNVDAIEPGQTLDCILKLRQNGSIKRWFADTIIHINNPIVDENLRWIILSHHSSNQQQQQQQQHQQQDVQNPKQSLSYKFGFPKRKRDVQEVYKLIRLHVQVQQQERQHKESRYNNYNRLSSIRNNHIRKQHQNGGNGSNTTVAAVATKSTSPLEGIHLDDLTLVLRKSKREIQEMVQHLQLQGRIYQNEKGEYLPL